MTKIEYKVPNAKDLRKFGLMMAVVICLFSLIAVWKQHWITVYVLWSIAGIVFLLPAIVYPQFLSPIHKYWMKFAMVLGWINSRIILSLVYYLLFTPISLIQKVIKRDALERRFHEDSDSYWDDRSKETYNPKHFERQF